MVAVDRLLLRNLYLRRTQWVPYMVLERIEYPTLFSVLLVGMIFLVTGAITDVLGMYGASGFFTIYAVVAFLLGGVGYGSLFLIKNVSRTMQRRRTRVN